MSAKRLLSPLAWLLLVLAAVLPAHADTAGNPIVIPYSTAGLGRDTKVWCVTEDDAGVMYFGGDRLYVSDGDHWNAYAMGNTYAIRSLDLAKDGRLWAAGFNELGWFNRNANGDWDYQSLRDKLPEDLNDLGDIWYVYATTEGAIFVSESYVLRWNGKAFTTTHYDVHRRLISSRYENAVYIYSLSNGLQRLDQGGSKTIATPDLLGSNLVFGLTSYGKELALFTTNGVGVIRDGKLEFIDKSLSAYAKKNVVTSVAHLPDGNHIIGTLTGGMVLVSPDLKMVATWGAKAGIADDIYWLYVTKAGRLWATSSAKLFNLFSPTQIVSWSHDFNAQNSVRSLAGDGERLLILTDEGVSRMDADDLNELSKFKGYGRDIAVTQNGAVVATTYNVVRISPSHAEEIYHAINGVFRVRSGENSNHTLFSVDRQIVDFNLSTKQSRALVHKLPDIAENFVTDSQGRFWISTASQSLLVATPSAAGAVEAESASLHHGFPTNEGYTQVAKLGDTIVGINETKAYWLNPRTDRFEPIMNFPVGNTLTTSDEDNKGRVWVAMEGSQANMPMRLGHLERNVDGVIWVPHSVAGLASVGTPRALQIQQTSEGDVLWIAGSGGLLQIKHPGEFAAIVPRQPVLTAVVRSTVDGPAQPITNTLPYSTRRIHLQFGSGEFALRDTLRYQTMLDGVDDNWSAPTNTAELELPNLREGDYTFKVRLLSDTGLASEPTQLRFTIAPPWWRTPYAYGGYAVVLGLALTGAYRLRVRTIRHRAEVLESTVKERTSELEKANAAKSEFVASMSHEIRNPMNGIIGSAHALADTPLSEEQREIVTTLRNCATFLSSLVEDVLDFSSIEAGVFNVQQQPYNPAGVLEAVATMLASHAIEAGAHFDIEVDPALPARLQGDPARIQQIMINYATNALKFSGGGRVRLSTYAENGEVVFAVTDNGPGISQDEQVVLFTRFSRLKTARNAGITGTGLGLAVCRAVAERMNGSVGVSSQAGHGATFYLRLPLIPATARPDRTITRSLPKFDGARALIVEDLPYNARILSAMLVKHGFIVDTAPTGSEALRLVKDQTYDAVFLDYDLPDMNGLEVARRMRQAPESGPRPLIVATTAYSTTQDRDACLNAGMDTFLSKPITPEKLHEALGGFTAPARHPSLLPAATPEPTLNLEMLTYLAGNNPEALKTEIKRFIGSIDTTREEVITALRTLNRPTLGRAAHRLLSHACMVKCDYLSSVTRDMETEANYANEERLEQLVADMDAAIAQLKKALDQHPAQAPA